jgi:hypothetical protein
MLISNRHRVASLKKKTLDPRMFASEVVEMDLLSCISFGDGICDEVNEIIRLNIYDLSPPASIPQPDSEK